LPIQPFKPWVLIHLLFTAPRYPKSSAKEECFDEEEIDREKKIFHRKSSIRVQFLCNSRFKESKRPKSMLRAIATTSTTTDESEGDADAQSQYSSGGTVLSPEVMFRGFQLR
jgi:hypothetical protein